MTEAIRVLSWSISTEGEALAFLRKNDSTSMFLLSNFVEHGPALTSHPNSGQFKILKKGSETIGVFCLTLRGNLLMSVQEAAPVEEILLRECVKEPFPLKGVLGGWEAASSFWEYLRAKQVVSSCSFSSKEILYRLDELSETPPASDVRLLGEVDFAQWLPIRKAYLLEDGLKLDLTDEELERGFGQQAADKQIWGCFDGPRLIATASLIAQASDLGQVGGVYTLPEFRGRGISQRTMRGLITDSVLIHDLRCMILFTGEKNAPAQRVYEKLGFQRIGHFGMFFA